MEIMEMKTIKVGEKRVILEIDDFVKWGGRVKPNGVRRKRISISRTDYDKYSSLPTPNSLINYLPIIKQHVIRKGETIKLYPLIYYYRNLSQCYLTVDYCQPCQSVVTIKGSKLRRLKKLIEDIQDEYNLMR